MATYTEQQQAFVISVLSNNAAGQTGQASAIATWLMNNVTSALGQTAFTDAIGKWSLVWGPVVWQDASQNSNVADNVMMAAQNSDTNDIVVAIAGTNPNSAFDRGTEDLDVGQTVTFDSTSGSWIAQGTSDGIGVLEAMTDSSGQTLVEYLNALAPTGANLIFAGHSLGGALAPSYALDLVFNSKLTTSNFENVYVYPSAGPSPGNAAFAALFAKTFPAVGSSGFNVWNQNIVNAWDAVPNGWTNLSVLPSLYPPINNGQPLTCIGILVDKELTPALNGNEYANLPRVTFDNGFEEGLQPPALGVTCQWLTQAIFQHIAAYFAEIIPDLQTLLPTPTLTRKICRELDAWCDLHRA